MTDYKELKLRASSSPHIRSGETTRRLMGTVLLALLPTLAAGVWFFGLRALLLTLVSVASCVASEWAFRAVTKSPGSIADGSAAVVRSCREGRSIRKTPASSTISAYLYFPMRPSAGWSFFRMPGECLSASMSAFLPVWRGSPQCRRSAPAAAPRSGFR